jgi:hypothetical protein
MESMEAPGVVHMDCIWMIPGVSTQYGEYSRSMSGVQQESNRRAHGLSGLLMESNRMRGGV